MPTKTSPKTYTELADRRGAGGRAKLAGGALTATIIRELQPGQDLADPEHPGLRVRKPAEGSPVFFYRYRAPLTGALRQVSVGVLGREMTLTTIRKEWERLRDAVRNGRDPQDERRTKKGEAQAKLVADKAAAFTLGDAVERYLVERVEKRRKPKGAAESRRMLERAVAPLSGTAAAKITRLEAHSLLLGIADKAPHVALMVRQEMRACWEYCIQSGYVTAESPFAGQYVGGDLRRKKGDRALSDVEAGALLPWMRKPTGYSRTVADALELTLRTGLRSGEVCGIHTSELRESAGVLWLTMPPARMKMGKEHRVPLVGRAADIVRLRMPAQPGFLFPSRKADKPIEQKVLGVEVYAHSGRSKAKAYAHLEVCPVKNWAPHDLRRTARTMLAELGCPFEVGEAILAHELPGVASVYNRAKYEAEKVEWLVKLGEHLDQLSRALGDPGGPKS